MHSTKKKTTEDFIKQASNIHNEKYDYSKVEYINNHSNVCIICNEHGEFWQSPKVHLRGCGCPQCSLIYSQKRKPYKDINTKNRKEKKKLHTQNNKKNDVFVEKNNVKDIVSFIENSNLVHNNKYNYEKFNYTNKKEKSIIICPEHGEFLQSPSQHLKGHGCPKCAQIKRAETQKFNKDFFLTLAKEKYGNKFDYSKIDYKDYTKTKICIICPEHGEFWQTPNSHLLHCGCTKCNTEYKKKIFSSNREEFIKRSTLLFYGIYSYDNVNYINNSTKVSITCPKHGDFLCTPSNHLKKRGCPICKTESYVYEERLYNLLLTIFDENEIIRQYTDTWLTNNKSIDFFLPSYKLAIEHNGMQHFMPVKIFGGEKKHLTQKQNDIDKLNECTKNDIKLLYFTYEYIKEITYIDKVYTNENEFIEILKKYKYGKNNWN